MHEKSRSSSATEHQLSPGPLGQFEDSVVYPRTMADLEWMAVLLLWIDKNDSNHLYHQHEKALCVPLATPR